MRAVLVWPMLLLSGCTITGFGMSDVKLIDQQSFEGPPRAPAPADLARARLPPLPLVVIRFDQPDEDYRPALAAAVNAAQARKPDIGFDVLTPMPTAAPPATQSRFASQGAADAQEVAMALAADGVAPDSIHIGLRGDPGAPVREVRVYAR